MGEGWYNNDLTGGSISHLTVSLTLGQQEDCGDGRSQVARYGLDDGDPADADGNDAQNPDSGDGRGAAGGMQQATGVDHTTSPAHDNELPLGGPWPGTSPDVHGEQGAAAGKDGGQREGKSVCLF